MRYGIALPHFSSFANPAAIGELAQAVEELGYDSLWVSDHIVIPVGMDFFPENIAEPLATLSYLAAITERVTLGTSVLVVPYRHPVFSAAFLSTVDVLSRGRLVVGIGVGRLEEEFRALSAPFEQRGARTDEDVAVWRNLWETEISSYDGKWTQYERVRMLPKKAPERDGKIPIIVGGTSQRALRRAAAIGDGWHPIMLQPEELMAGRETYHRLCREAGRTPGPVYYRHLAGYPVATEWPFAGGTSEQAEQVRRYVEVGVDELILDATILSRTETETGPVIGLMAKFMQEAVPKVTDRQGDLR
jgi:probable F420-dependent oxidoreductase